MGVHLREKQLKKGKTSLYLDFYPPISNPITGEQTRREFLKLYIYEKPKTDNEKIHNKEVKIKANEILAIRQRQFYNNEIGLYNTFNKKKDFLKYFLKLTENKLNESSKNNYQSWMSAYKYLSRFTHEKCTFGDLNDQLCNDFKTYLLTTYRLNSKSRKLKPNSAHSYFNKFKAALKQAFEDRLINENFGLRVKGIEQEETDREFITIEELNKLAKTECSVPKLKEAAIFSALTGLRWGDVNRLKWSDIQHSKEMGNFIYKKNSKTNSNDYHPINEQAVQILGDRGDNESFIFEGLKYNDSTNNQLKLWILKAGINKKITFHNFRHSYATLLLSNGVDIATVSKMLNHKHIKTTMVYAKVMVKAKKEAANSIKMEL